MTFHVDQNDRTSKFGLKSCERRLDVRPQLHGPHLIGYMGIDRVEMSGKGVGPLSLFLAELVVAGVYGNPVEPGREGALSVVLICLAVKREKRFLGGVQRFGPVAQHPKTQPEDAVLVVLHQLRESALVTADEPIDEFAVSHARDRSVGCPQPVTALSSAEPYFLEEGVVVRAVILHSNFRNPQEP